MLTLMEITSMLLPQPEANWLCVSPTTKSSFPVHLLVLQDGTKTQFVSLLIAIPCITI